MKNCLYPVAFIVLSALAAASLLQASDLSSYRQFHLGNSAADVATQTGMESSELRLVSSRPERIEELDWKTNRSALATTPSDSVREIRFRFYNGSLFEMMVRYDMDRTGGLTDADMTEALSAIYGSAAQPAAKEMAFNSGYNTTVRVIAQWHDAQNLLSLVGFSHGDGFGVIVSSNDSLALARRAMVESDRLDYVEAPQRAREVKAKQEAETAARDEQFRSRNKPDFRP